MREERDAMEEKFTLTRGARYSSLNSSSHRPEYGASASHHWAVSLSAFSLYPTAAWADVWGKGLEALFFGLPVFFVIAAVVGMQAGRHCASRRLSGLKGWLVTLGSYSLLGFVFIASQALRREYLFDTLIGSLLLSIAIALLPLTVFFALTFWWHNKEN